MEGVKELRDYLQAAEASSQSSDKPPSQEVLHDIITVLSSIIDNTFDKKQLNFRWASVVALSPPQNSTPVAAPPSSDPQPTKTAEAPPSTPPAASTPPSTPPLGEVPVPKKHSQPSRSVSMAQPKDKWRNRFYTISDVPRDQFLSTVEDQKAKNAGNAKTPAQLPAQPQPGSPKSAVANNAALAAAKKRQFSTTFKSRMSIFEKDAAALNTAAAAASAAPNGTASGETPGEDSPSWLSSATALVDRTTPKSPRSPLNRTASLPPSRLSSSKLNTEKQEGSTEKPPGSPKASGEKSAEPASPKASPKAASVDPTPEQLEKRGYIINEIITTEQNYLRDLKVIVSEYVQPLKKDNVLNPTELRSVFSQVEVIANISETVVKKLDTEMARANGSDPNVGKIFLDMSEFLKSYSAYINNYDNAMLTIQGLKKSNKRFVKFLEACDKNPLCRQHTIEDFLIIVIQRIPRYVMLLEDLTRNTATAHNDHAFLTKAVSKVKEIAEYVNSAKKNTEKLQRGVKIQHDAGIRDIPAHRSFLREETMFTRPPQAGKVRKVSYHFGLFSDILLVSKWKSDAFHSSRKYEILQTDLALNSTEPGQPVGLKLPDEDKTYWAATNEQLSSFVKAFLDVKTGAENKEEALEKRRRSAGVEDALNAEARTRSASAAPAVKGTVVSGDKRPTLLSPPSPTIPPKQ